MKPERVEMGSQSIPSVVPSSCVQGLRASSKMRFSAVYAVFPKSPGRRSMCRLYVLP